MKIDNNEAQRRFETMTAAGLAKLDYRLEGNTLYLDYVYVPSNARGHGVASDITLAALEWARERRLKVIPVCGYVSAFLRRHTEFADLRA